jgi:F0F1-type ATP synthase membrane subunit b/b'
MARANLISFDTRAIFALYLSLFCFNISMHLLAFAESIQLFPDGTIFIHIALILYMIWVLNRTFFRPVNKVIQSRENFKNVEGGEPGSIQQQAAEKEVTYNRELLEARSEGYAFVEKEHAKIVRAREKKLAETKAETDQQIAGEKTDLERQTADAKAAIGPEANQLADRIAATVLKS